MTLTVIALKGYPADAPLPDSVPVRDGYGGPTIGSATFERSATVPGDIIAEVTLTADVNVSLSFDWAELNALRFPKLNRS